MTYVAGNPAWTGATAVKLAPCNSTNAAARVPDIGDNGANDVRIKSTN